MNFSTPVALLIFNRPDKTNRVFEAIRQVKPQKLLIVADGSRFPEEDEKCSKTREIVQKVDWECEVLTNFSDTNLGCKRRVSSGLNWVFSQVEEAIILEDDCLPTSSFFKFCETLLEYYRHNEQIMMISGANFQDGQIRNNYSYYFSKYAHIWGWASWRRAWQHYDVEIKTWPEYRQLNLISSICNDAYEQQYWTNIFDNVFDGLIETWDYQWLYTCWLKKGLSIIPNYNLISNIGFGSDATHTFSSSPWSNLPTQDIWQIKHPRLISRNNIADDYTFAYHYGGNDLKLRDSFLFKLKRKISSVKSLIKK
ncbi:MAG: glycosyltransferase family 2 protein [Calothrix sp. C42_A2020_038]|nr:glycosyltransferase family 2 protein [Calothrix sp. C42_A2020_038]